MKNRRLTAILLSASALALSLTACGASSDSAAKAAESTKSAESASQTDGTTAQTAETTAAEKTGAPVTVKLGVVGSIYEDLWAPAKEALKSEGINLDIVQFSDYVTPNNALANGEIDLNAFQHRIYLDNEIKSYGYKIQNIGNTFIIPLNLYSKKAASVE